MTMHTDLYCDSLDSLDRATAVRAIHEAWLQLAAIGHRVEVGDTTYDNAPALEALTECLRQAGYVGLPEKQ